ncbi:hypothetical protein ACN3E9_10980 [Vibrio pectenicida]|uniref:hypothetical protein n=1 Tax=Vibrio pectenicida TaxID=62763 RepID=UPI003B9BF070
MGTKPIDERVVVFKSGISPEATGFEYNTFFGPLIITVVLLAIQPWLQRYVFIYMEWNRSEGLKQRDKYSSETMLTLEQSNELRASVQKFQQFHQEVLKNKEEEINEYKRQLESKDNEANTFNDKNLKLIEEKTELESEKSELSVNLATVRGELADLESKYQRLSKILSNSRQAKRNLSNQIKSNNWFVNDKTIREFPQLVELDSRVSSTERASYLKNMQLVSNDADWLYSCNEIAVYVFSKVWSFDMANDYFSELIRPNLDSMEEDQIRRLIHVMENNGQIRDRNRAETDMQVVIETLESRVAKSI